MASWSQACKHCRLTLKAILNCASISKCGLVSAHTNRGGLIEAQNPRKLTHCVDESYSANVDVEGNVILCANDYVGDHRYGNVNEKGIVSIWYGKEFKDLRSRKKRGHFDLDICKKCVGE